MARRLTILVSCDGCDASDLPQDAGLVLAVGNDAPRQVDLCDTCKDQVWGPMAALYAEACAAPTPEPRVEEDPIICPDCGYECPSRSALRSHLETRHHTDTGAWQFEHGHAIDDPLIPVPFVCDRCTPGRAYVNAQGLAIHTRAAHSQ